MCACVCDRFPMCNCNGAYSDGLCGTITGCPIDGECLFHQYTILDF